MTRSARLAAAALLYGAIALTANAVPAAELSSADRAALKAMRAGDMAKLVIHDAPRDRIGETFRDVHGNPVTVADYAGKIVVLNIWATWCPPCRAEMPSLDRLAGQLGGPDLAVVPISTDHGGTERIEQFFKDIHVRHLPLMHDRGGAVARRAGALGLPMTLILDREGREIARMLGDADWDSPEAQSLLRRVIELTGRHSEEILKT